MQPRITLNQNKDGELEVWINEAGRDLLVSELERLGDDNDHFHLTTDSAGPGVPIKKVSYRDDGEIIESAKVMFRRDDWDARFFPHVLHSSNG